MGFESNKYRPELPLFREVCLLAKDIIAWTGRNHAGYKDITPVKILVKPGLVGTLRSGNIIWFFTVVGAVKQEYFVDIDGLLP